MIFSTQNLIAGGCSLVAAAWVGWITVRIRLLWLERAEATRRWIPTLPRVVRPIDVVSVNDWMYEPTVTDCRFSRPSDPARALANH